MKTIQHVVTAFAVLFFGFSGICADRIGEFLYTVRDEHSWQKGTLAALQKSYAVEMTDKSQTAKTRYKAAIDHALTTLIMLGENKLIADTCKQFGCTLNYATMSFSGEFTLNNPPQTNTLVDNALRQAQPAVELALKDLDSIPDDWEGRVKVTTDEYPIDEDILVDLADVLYMKSALKAVLGVMNWVKGYNTQFNWKQLREDMKLYTIPRTDDVASVPNVPFDKDKAVKSIQVSCLDPYFYIRIVKHTTSDWPEEFLIDFNFRDSNMWPECHVSGRECFLYINCWRGYNGYEWWGGWSTDEGDYGELTPELVSKTDSELILKVGVSEMHSAGAPTLYLEGGEFSSWSSGIYTEYDAPDAAFLKMPFDQTTMFDKVRDKAALGKAKTYVSDALKLAKSADKAVLERDSADSFLVNYSEEDEDSIAIMRENLDRALASLTFAQEFDWREMLGEADDGSHTWIPNPLSINLGALFAGNITRGMVIPPSASDDEYVACLDEILDPTLAGLFPDMTVPLLEQGCKDIGIKYRNLPFGFIIDPEADPVEVAAGEMISIPLEVAGAGNGYVVTVDTKTLPAGLKLVKDRVTGDYSLTGTPTMPGTYEIALTLTDARKRVSKTVLKVTVPNFKNSVFCVDDALEFDPGVEITPIDLRGCGLDFDAGDKLTVSGLPAGLQYDANTQMITGKPTTPGAKTVVFTATTIAPKATVKASSTYTVMDFPALSLVTETDDSAGYGSDAGGVLIGGGNYPGGKTVTLTAKPNAGYVFAGWFGLDDERAKNVDYRSATIRYKTALFAEEITGLFVSKGLDLESLDLDIPVWNEDMGCTGSVTKKNEYGEQPFLDVYVGIQCAQQVECMSVSAVNVTMQGLPRGLKFDTSAFQIVGVPTAPATGVATNVVKVTMKNASGSKKLEFKVRTYALPDWVKGTHTGLVKLSGTERQPWNGYYYKYNFGENPFVKYGKATMTVGAQGKVTGKFQLEGKTTSFSSSSLTDLVPNDGYGLHECADYPGCPRLITSVTLDGKVWTAVLDFSVATMYDGEGIEIAGLGRTGGIDDLGRSGLFPTWTVKVPDMFDVGTWYDFTGECFLGFRQDYASRIKQFGRLPAITVARALTRENTSSMDDGMMSGKYYPFSDYPYDDYLNLKISPTGAVTLNGKIKGSGFSASTAVTGLEINYGYAQLNGVSYNDCDQYRLTFDLVIPSNVKTGCANVAYRVTVPVVLRGGKLVGVDKENINVEGVY